MKSRVRRAALCIALLREEFTEAELLEAVHLLGVKRSTSALLTLLAGKEATEHDSLDQVSRAGDGFPQAVLALKDTDTEKFEALVYFLRVVDENGAKLSHLRRLGARLSKSFRSSGTRRDILTELTELLVNLPPSEIHQLADELVADMAPRDGGYQRLSQYIVDGIGGASKKQ